MWFLTRGFREGAAIVVLAGVCGVLSSVPNVIRVSALCVAILLVQMARVRVQDGKVTISGCLTKRVIEVRQMHTPRCHRAPWGGWVELELRQGIRIRLDSPLWSPYAAEGLVRAIQASAGPDVPDRSSA